MQPIDSPVVLLKDSLPGDNEGDFSAPSTTELRGVLLDGLAIIDVDDESGSGLVAAMSHTLDYLTKETANIISWDSVKRATHVDERLQEVISSIEKGFPSDGRSFPANL